MQEALIVLLEDIKRERSRRNRGELAENICELCFAENAKLTEREMAHVFNILRALVGDVEMHVRKTLAEHLSERDDPPHDLIMALANDSIEVAFPILARNNVLQDQDLIQLITEHTREHRLPISQRKSVSPAISEALVRTNDTVVIASLLRNDGAEFSTELLEELVEASRDVGAFREPLVRRQDLTPDLAQRMYAWVGDALRQYIVSAFKLEQRDLEAAISRAMTEAMQQYDLDLSAQSEESVILGRSQISRASGLLIGLLREEDFRRFESQFGRYAALPPSAIRRVLYHSGAEGLAIACKGLGFDSMTFSEIFFYLHGGRSDPRFRTSPKYHAAMEYFYHIDPIRARHVLKAWREAPPEG
jgi:uncharacterized protein (DUF2336 family)